MKLAVIADDLTGASDTGVQFRKWGLSVEVLIGLNYLSDTSRRADIIVVDTESRADPPGRAYEKARKAADKLMSQGIEQIYKKIDSTLRGNIGAELDAVMDACEAEVAFVAPAYPDNERTTVDGYQLIHGIPIDKTEYAPELGIKEAHIPTLIGLQSGRKVGHIPLETVRKGFECLKKRVEVLTGEGIEIIVFDAIAEKDLAIIAKESRNVEILCGSAGLASELPSGLGLRSVKPTLTICGSTRSLARTQVKTLNERLGCTIVGVEALKLLYGALSHIDELDRCVENVSEELINGTDVFVTSAPNEDSVQRTLSYALDHGIDAAEVRIKVEEALAAIALRVIDGAQISGLILTGGATALKVCRALKVEGVEILEEVQPGIPLISLTEGLKAVTKAGGFGGETSLVEAVKYLRRLS